MGLSMSVNIYLEQFNIIFFYEACFCLYCKTLIKCLKSHGEVLPQFSVRLIYVCMCDEA